MRSIIGYVFSVLLLLAGVSPALADCPKYNTLPRAREGAVGYDKTDKCIFLCDGTQWQTQCPTVTNPGCTGICVPGSDQTPFNVCFEAENPANTGVNSIVDTTTPPGGKMRSSFGNTSEYLDFAPFTIPDTGYYTLDIYYASAEDPSAGITPNGGTLQTLYLGTSYIQNQFISWSTVAKKSVNIPLNQGSNNLRIAGTNSGGAFSLDKICIHNDAPIDYCASGTSWQTSAWDSCSASCGGGTQTRSVSCLGSDGATVCPNAKCTGAMPAVNQSCNLSSCDPCSSGATWQYGSYSACSATCGAGTQSRSATCVATNGTTCSAASCSGSPVTSRSCSVSCCPNTTTEYCGTKTVDSCRGGVTTYTYYPAGWRQNYWGPGNSPPNSIWAYPNGGSGTCSGTAYQCYKCTGSSTSYISSTYGLYCGGCPSY